MKRLIAFALLCLPLGTYAFKLNMVDHDTDAARQAGAIAKGSGVDFNSSAINAIMSGLSDPVHERLTRASYDCGDCRGDTVVEQVMAGVQWNDNPPGTPNGGQLKECHHKLVLMPLHQPGCWLLYFRGAMRMEDKSSISENDLMLYRTHFGDMQFLHAMASVNDEPALTTRDRMLTWAEYAYRLSLAGGDEQLPLDAPIGKFAPMQPWFNGRKKYWLPQQLFRESLVSSDELLRNMAFGSLLHLVQDSYSRSHVARDSADMKITQHYSYADQSMGCHGEPDKEGASDSTMSAPNVAAAVEAGRKLIAFRAANTPWTEVADYLRDAVFAQRPDAVKASAGPFRKVGSKCGSPPSAVTPEVETEVG